MCIRDSSCIDWDESVERQMYTLSDWVCREGVQNREERGKRVCEEEEEFSIWGWLGESGWTSECSHQLGDEDRCLVKSKNSPIYSISLLKHSKRSDFFPLPQFVDIEQWGEEFTLSVRKPHSEKFIQHLRTRINFLFPCLDTIIASIVFTTLPII